MLDRADSILKLALAAAALLIGLSVAYYYAMFLPAQAAATEKATKDAENHRREEVAKSEAAKTAQVESAKLEYANCLSDAQFNYSSRWDSTCKTKHDDAMKAKKDCIANYGEASYCDNITVPPAKDCSLPSVTSDAYDAALQSARRLCFDKMAISTGQTPPPSSPAS